MQIGRVIAAGLCFSLLGARTAPAQVARGFIVLPDSVTRAIGVLVTAVDGSGTVVARALTGALGEFEVALPHPGDYGLRVLRIGYRPTVTPTLRVPQEGRSAVRIVLNDERVQLEQITVRESRTCRLRADSGLLVSRLWEEARKALTSSSLLAGGKRLDVMLSVYERTTDSTGRVVRKQSAGTRRGSTNRPFFSAPAATLAQVGYVTEDRDGLVFIAPDADVLLSDSFAGSHCFRVASPSEEHARQIGVGFRPQRDRGEVRDIEGTFWLDAASAELRSLDFQYTNLPQEYLDAGAGGHLEFLRLPSGHWLISRWEIRMPSMTRKAGVTYGDTFRSNARVSLDAVHMSGGDVASATFEGRLLYAGDGPLFEAVVISHDSAVAVDGAMVSLAGTGYVGHADSAGRVRIEHVLPGRYVAQFSTPLMRAAGMSPVERRVDVVRNAKAEPDTLKIPGLDDLITATCGTRGKEKPSDAILYGAAADVQGHPVAGATVAVAWQARIRKEFTVLRWQLETHDTKTDSIGRWRVCHVPRDWPLAVSAEVNGVKTDTLKLRIPVSRALHALNILAPPTKP